MVGTGRGASHQGRRDTRCPCGRSSPSRRHHLGGVPLAWWPRRRGRLFRLGARGASGGRGGASARADSVGRTLRGGGGEGRTEGRGACLFSAMFPIAVRWQVVRNRQRGLGWDSIVDHAGCSLRAAHQWWENFERNGSPWNDDCIQNQHADSARFNATFLRALNSLVTAHPEIFLRELSSLFQRLEELPDWNRSWPTSVTTLGLMLRQIGYSVKKVERLASERCLERMVDHCRLMRHIPDRCIVVADETHIKGDAMVRPRGRAKVGFPLEALAPDPRATKRFSSIVAISHSRGILELSVNEVPPAQGGDDWALFCTSLATRMNAYVPGALWADQPDDCVLLYDNASVHTALADEILTMNGVFLLRLPPYCPNLSAVEPTFADYKREARNIAYHHPDLPHRLLHVLSFASIPLATIQGHYREARREMSRHLPELTGPGAPLEGVLRALPVELAPP